MATGEIIIRFPLTVAGKLEYEMTFRRLERRGSVREISDSNAYALGFTATAYLGKRGITVIK